MAAFAVRLDHGRFVLDDEASSSDTPPLALVIEDEGDELDEAELVRLEQALESSLEASARGETFSMEEVIEGLRALRLR